MQPRVVSIVVGCRYKVTHSSTIHIVEYRDIMMVAPWVARLVPMGLNATAAQWMAVEPCAR